MTVTPPCTPCGRPIEPSSSPAAATTRLLHDVDVGLDALGRAGGPDHLSQRLDHPAALADEPPHVAGTGVHEQLHLVATLAHVDLDGLGLLGDIVRHVLDDRPRPRPDDAVAFRRDLIRVLLVDVDDRRVLAGAVVADDLDEATVAGGTGVGDDDTVGGLLLLSHPHKADLHGHVRWFPLEYGVRAKEAPAGRISVLSQRPGTGRRGILPLATDRIICCTILNCLSIPLTSAVL